MISFLFLINSFFYFFNSLFKKRSCELNATGIYCACPCMSVHACEFWPCNHVCQCSWMQAICSLITRYHIFLQIPSLILNWFLHKYQGFQVGFSCCRSDTLLTDFPSSSIFHLYFFSVFLDRFSLCSNSGWYVTHFMTLQTRLRSNTQRFICLCLPNAEIKGVTTITCLIIHTFKCRV